MNSSCTRPTDQHTLGIPFLRVTLYPSRTMEFR